MSSDGFLGVDWSGGAEAIADAVFSGLNEKVVEPIFSTFNGLIETLVYVILTPAKPPGSARYISGVDGATLWGNGVWGGVQALNAAFTNLALGLFSMVFLLYIIGLGIGYIEGDISENLFKGVLGIILILVNEEILLLLYGTVNALTWGVIESTSITGTGGIDSIGAVLGQVIVGVAMYATGTLGFGLTIGVALFLFALLLMLIIAGIYLIGMIGYAIFPLITLLWYLGELWGHAKQTHDKLVGFFIPPMYAPFLFAIVFKFAAFFMTNALGYTGTGTTEVANHESASQGALTTAVAGGVDLGANMIEGIIGPFLFVFFLFIGVWLVIKNMKAGQAVMSGVKKGAKLAGTAAVVAATGGAAAGAGAGGLSSGAKGAAKSKMMGGDGLSSALGGYSEVKNPGGGGMMPGGGGGVDTESDQGFLGDFKAGMGEMDDKAKSPIRGASDRLGDTRVGSKINDGTSRARSGIASRTTSESPGELADDITDEDQDAFGRRSLSDEAGMEAYQDEVGAMEDQIEEGENAEAKVRNMANAVGEQRGMSAAEKETFADEMVEDYNNERDHLNRVHQFDDTDQGEIDKKAFSSTLNSGIGDRDKSTLGHTRLSDGEVIPEDEVPGSPYESTTDIADIDDPEDVDDNKWDDKEVQFENATFTQTGTNTTQNGDKVQKGYLEDEDGNKVPYVGFGVDSDHGAEKLQDGETYDMSGASTREWEENKAFAHSGESGRYNQVMLDGDGEEVAESDSNAESVVSGGDVSEMSEEARHQYLRDTSSAGFTDRDPANASASSVRLGAVDEDDMKSRRVGATTEATASNDGDDLTVNSVENGRVQFSADAEASDQLENLTDETAAESLEFDAETGQFSMDIGEFASNIEEADLSEVDGTADRGAWTEVENYQRDQAESLEQDIKANLSQMEPSGIKDEVKATLRKESNRKKQANELASSVAKNRGVSEGEKRNITGNFAVDFDATAERVESGDSIEGMDAGDRASVVGELRAGDGNASPTVKLANGDSVEIDTGSVSQSFQSEAGKVVRFDNLERPAPSEQNQGEWSNPKLKKREMGQPNPTKITVEDEVTITQQDEQMMQNVNQMGEARFESMKKQLNANEQTLERGNSAKTQLTHLMNEKGEQEVKRVIKEAEGVSDSVADNVTQEVQKVTS